MNPAKLYVSDHIEALDTIAAGDLESWDIRTITKVDTLHKLARRLYESLNVEANDQERCYIIAKRYLMVIDQLFKFEGDARFIHSKYDSEISTVRELVSDLRESLSERYRRASQESMQIKAIEQAPPKEAPRFFLNNYISSKDLYDSITKYNDVLLVDLRPRIEFEATHIVYRNIINIPQELIQVGLSANTLGYLLPPADLEIWDRRDKFSALIIIDWNNTSPQLELLREILIDWDLSRQYEQSPVMLSGGFKEFIETYPTQVENSHMFLINKNDDLDDLLDLDEIAYPDSEIKLSPQPVLQPQPPQEPMPSTSRKSPSPPQKLPSPVSKKRKSPPPIPDKPKPVTPVPKHTSTYKQIFGSESDSSESDSDKKKPNQADIKSAIEENRLKELQRARQLKPATIPPRPSVPFINRDTKPFATGDFLRKTGMVGLKNLRNTCYMNTVIQCFRALPFIKNFLISNTYKPLQRRFPSALLEETAKIVKILWSDCRCISPADFYKSVCALEPNYRKGNHEDCMEFFLFMLNTLIEDSYTTISRDNLNEVDEAFYNALQGRQSVFIELIYHQIKTQRRCERCNTSTHMYETDSTIMLPVPAHNCHLDGLMREYFQDYTIPDFVCTTCGSPLRHRKTFVRQPQVLVVVLKRYFQRENTADLNKNNVRVGFATENFVVGQSSYRLISVAMHQGTLTGGHYTAGCYINDRWVECNDDYLFPLNIQSDRTQSLVCAFFYTRE